MTHLMDTHVSQDLTLFVHENSWSLRRSGWFERNAFDRVDALDWLDKDRWQNWRVFNDSHSARCARVFLFVCMEPESVNESHLDESQKC